MYASGTRLWVTNSSSEIGRLEFLTNKFTRYDTIQLLKDSIFKYNTYTDENNCRWMLSDFCVFRYDSSMKKMVLYRVDMPSAAKSGFIIKDTVQKQNVGYNA